MTKVQFIVMIRKVQNFIYKKFVGPLSVHLMVKNILPALHGCSVHQQYQILYFPTNALNYMNCRLLKTH